VDAISLASARRPTEKKKSQHRPLFTLDPLFGVWWPSRRRETMQLASSIWPKTDDGRGNTARVSVPGPRKGVVAAKLELPSPGKNRDGRGAGLAVADDGTFRVASRGQLTAYDAAWALLWSTPLSKNPEEYHSAPTLLDDGTTLVTTAHQLLFIGPSGEVEKRIDASAYDLDDSGPAPCVTQSGTVVLATVMGELLGLEDGSLVELGAFGEDILPTAVFSDDSLAVAGYAGAGFCRLRLDGSTVWRTGLDGADLLPMVTSKDLSAVGSMNDKRSEVYSPDGSLLFRYPRAAVFAEHLDGGFVALSDGVVAMLTPGGSVRWEAKVSLKRGWGSLQPIVDETGAVYVLEQGGVVCFDRDGRRIFTAKLGDGTPAALAIVESGRLAALIGDVLFLVE
jgi:outer membrane protein assembly factor BamB